MPKVVARVDKSKLDRFLNSSSGAPQRWLSDRADEVERKAKANCPVDSGGVRDSITSRRAATGVSGGRATQGIVIEATDPASEHVHQGTGPGRYDEEGLPSPRANYMPADSDEIRGWAARHGMNPWLARLHVQQHGTPASLFLLRALQAVFVGASGRWSK